MTLNGAIKQLHELRSAEDMPIQYKPVIAEVINVLLMDTQEVRHGKWIFNPRDGIEAMFTKPKCSVCGFESADGLNYCSNCGASMDVTDTNVGSTISGEQAMAFPNTWKEFEEEYGFTDEDRTYTNGSRLIPSFRVEQWLEYIARPKGKWENIDIIHIRKDAKITDWQQAQCSVCGKWQTKPYLYGIDLDHYCPYCGAKMVE